MTAEIHSTRVDHVSTSYQLLLFVDSDVCATDSFEMAALRLLHEDGLIRLVEPSENALLPNEAIAHEYDVDPGLYTFIYGLLHPEHDGGIATVCATEKAMQVAKAVRHGADIFVTNDPRISHRDRPFERQTDMHLLEPVEALELVMQEIRNAD